MTKVTIQVPTDKRLKEKATKSAQEMGFSSIQEVLRVFMTKLASGRVSVSLEENVEYLTPQEEAVLEQRHKEFMEDKKKGSTFVAHSAKEMVDELMS